MECLIPMPNYIENNKKKFSFQNFNIIVEEKYKKALDIYLSLLNDKLEVDENAPIYLFQFSLNKKLKDEEYSIVLDENQCFAEGGSERAIFYASMTLAQLFSLKGGKKVKKIVANSCYIEDKPRFKYRSFLLDECRHFFGIEEVKKYIDILSYLKINYFHWHLSDDQGFRINFQSFPKLKEIASKRNKTKINSQDNADWDENKYEHCYDYHEIKEIISYAKKHYVEIIPEIDMPGHSSAIVAAYPELHCFGEQKEVRGDFGVFKDIMCLGKDYTYDFCKKLLTELCILFKDSHYIHIGGDEVSFENYEKCPDCKKKMEELNLTSPKELQGYFSNQMAAFIEKEFGKKVIMWHDGVSKSTNQNTLMQYWDYKMDEEKIKFINEGRKTIYSPCSQFYFNDPYAELPLSTTYNRGIHLTGLTRNALKNIMGMECCIWTEWVTNSKMLEFNTFPRLMAFSESAWTNTTNHNFTNFVERCENFRSVLKAFNLECASKKIYLAYGKKYRSKVSGLYRGVEKEIELKMSSKI